MEHEMRWAEPQDYDALGQLMFEAIHSAPSPYSEAERNAWRVEPYAGPDWHVRLGWFRKLFEGIERRARDIGETRLHTHASLAAEGPFKSVGFHVTERETVALNGQSLRRAAMEKPLL
jgi:putative acetyltransferase